MTGNSSRQRMPTIYVPHGGGPWPWIPSQRESYAPLRSFLEKLPGRLPQTPRAILMISAHWEEQIPTLMSAAHPEMFYDYSGFPPQTYELEWPAPGDPQLARDVQSLLADSGIPSKLDPDRGFDHGAFVPLALSYPQADVPTLQLSLITGLDPAEHLRLGRALAPLRDDGILILGSGMSYHNMRGFFGAMQGKAGPEAPSTEFDDWLASSVTMPEEQRTRRLLSWGEAPRGRDCHPREEHLLPLHVVVGAGLGDGATLPFRGSVLGARVSAVRLG